MTNNENIEIFKSVFKGREDIYAVRWEKTGKSGYMPAYEFDWNEFMTHKSKGGAIRDFENKKLIPYNDLIIQSHLLGNKTIGIYPLLVNNYSYFIAADFDEKSWVSDSLEFINKCKENNIPAYLERSRSGNGGHVWIFFEEAYPAVKSRQIAFEIQKKVFNISEFQKEISFDRLFPNQDYLSKQGFGNLIALPLNGKSLENGNSCFIDTNTNEPFKDQWKFLKSINKINSKDLDNLYEVLVKKSVIVELDNISTVTKKGTTKKMPTERNVTSDKIIISINNYIVLDKSSLSSIIIHFIKDQLNFLNPDYLIRKRIGKSVYKTEKYFNLIKEQDGKVLIPRGFLDSLIEFLDENNISYKIVDERKEFDDIDCNSNINLYKYQEKAIKITENKTNGIIVSPPGSGKTIMALKIMEQKKKPALIILHRKELLNQWKDRISSFFGIDKKDIGQIGGGKDKIGKHLTVAMIQGLSKNKNLSNLGSSFGTIIIDECHHIPAKTFRETISQFSPNYMYGFTATPKRKNSDEKLIYAYIGDIISEIDSEDIKYDSQNKDKTSKNSIIIRETDLFVPFNYKLDKYETISKVLIYDTKRNKIIVDDIILEIENKKKILILTERKEQTTILNLYLKNNTDAIILTGEDNIKERKNKIEQIKALNFQAVIATGQFLGEGIDLNVFDCLFLIYPFSFEGKLIQYIGRVNRTNNTHSIYDYRDRNIDYFEKLFKNRMRYYNKLENKGDYNISLK